MQKGGQKLSQILAQLVQLTKPGANLLDIEKKAVQLIKAADGEPAFSRLDKYRWATCLNINEGIVHGVPRDYKIKKGDLINIDIGLYYQGFNTDMSTTIRVKNGKKNLPIDKFLLAGKKALEAAEKQAKPGNRVGHISQKIQQIIEKAGYNCILSLSGHGIGKKLHEPPIIPCVLKKDIKKTPLLKTGMVLAIEVIYTRGKPDLLLNSKDKWTIKTKDGKISAVFEETIAITKNRHLVLTKLLF